MGAGISTNNEDHDGYFSSSKTCLDDIPESCISSIMMKMDPQEICKLARVNKTFHRASSDDYVWESKLPQSYKFLVNKIIGEEKVYSMTKKKIYAKLSQPNIFDDGTKVSNSKLLISSGSEISNFIYWFCFILQFY